MKIKYIKSSVKESGNQIGNFIFSELIPGQGLTIGNALRRVLLSNLEGVAITGIKIPKISHEFSIIPYIREDILEIILNLKQIVLSTDEPNKIFGKIKASGPGIITANSLIFDSDVKIINPNQYIATISSKKSIEFDIIVERGIGYQFSEEKKDQIFGFLSIDAIFMPVVKVNYQINETYIKDNKIEESLLFEIVTNGSLTPEIALQKAAKELSLLFDLLKYENILQ